MRGGGGGFLMVATMDCASPLQSTHTMSQRPYLGHFHRAHSEVHAVDADEVGAEDDCHRVLLQRRAAAAAAAAP